MKLLQITDAQYVNLETATIVSPDDENGAIRFYIPAVDIALDRVYTLPGIRVETAMMAECDMDLWVEANHPAFHKIHEWLISNSF